MKPGKLIVYFLVLLAVGAFVYFYEIEHRQSESAKEEEKQKIVSLDRAKITQIQLQSGKDGNIELKKPGDTWVMTEPIKTKADESAVTSLIHSAVTSKTEKTVLEKDVNWTEYGLDKPGFTLILETPEKQVTLAFGSQNPAKSSYYARVDGKPELLMVADTLKNSLDKPVIDLRDKTIVGMAVDDVEKITLRTKEGATEFVRSQPGRWEMASPEKIRVKSIVMSNNVRILTSLAAEDIIDKPKMEGDPYGFAQPEQTIVIGGPKLEQTLVIGKQTEDAGKGQPSLYAKIEGLEPVFVVPAQSLNGLKTKPDEVRDRLILSLNPSDVEKIQIDLDGKTWLAAQSKDKKWDIEKPVKKEKMEPWPISSLLFDIRDLEWKSLEPVPQDLTAVGLNKPEMQIQLFRRDGKEPIIIKAGWETPKQDDKEAKGPHQPEKINIIAAPSQEENSMYVADGKLVSRIREALKALEE